ncbi:MAG: hypothetical protein R2861_02760 [Desulfobacterales bacterium]
MAPVLDTFKTLHAKNIHFEMTTLVVPEYVDNPKMISHMCRWIIDHLGPDHPLHFLRFFPSTNLDRLPPTPVSLLTNSGRSPWTAESDMCMWAMCPVMKATTPGAMAGQTAD